MAQGLPPGPVVKTPHSYAGGMGLIPGEGTGAWLHWNRGQLKISHAGTKTQHSQINK